MGIGSLFKKAKDRILEPQEVKLARDLNRLKLIRQKEEGLKNLRELRAAEIRRIKKARGNQPKQQGLLTQMVGNVVSNIEAEERRSRKRSKGKDPYDIDLF